MERARAALETPAVLTADGSNALIWDIAHAEKRLSSSPLPWPIDVHVAVIEHRHGTNLHVALDANTLDAHVAAYCREWWREIGDDRDMCARGRKRGIGTIVATQRLAKLASSVVSELHNHLIGLNVFDRDVARAADLLGFGSDQAALLRQLPPGEFFAFGPALAARLVLAKIDPTITPHIGRTPDLVAAVDLDPDESRSLLDLDALREVALARAKSMVMRGQRALDAFLSDPAAPAAARIIGALGPMFRRCSTGMLRVPIRTEARCRSRSTSTDRAGLIVIGCK